MSLEFKTQSFDEDVLKSDLPVLVDFWAPWCPPCRRIGPFVDAIATKYEGKAKVGKVNIDQESELSERYGVFSIPTLLFFKNGKKVETLVGAHNQEKIEAVLNGLA